ncbi:MAG: hypothetical protein NTY09_01265 [bacterium]|nr:hypothetical protein [bacterium]
MMRPADETTSEGQDTSEGIQESGFNFEDAVINDFPGMYSIFPMVDPFDLSGGSTESSAISGQDGLSTIGTE